MGDFLGSRCIKNMSIIQLSSQMCSNVYRLLNDIEDNNAGLMIYVC